MYSNLFRELLTQNFSVAGATSDQVKMIGAIHRVISPQLSYDAMASAILKLLVAQTTESIRVKQDSLVFKLRGIIRSMVTHFGAHFDSYLLADSLMSFDVSTDTWSVEDEEDKARLMFQCIVLTVLPYTNQPALSEDDTKTMKASLSKAKRLLLTWCCAEYGPHFSSKGQLVRSNYFRSALGVNSLEVETTPKWLSAMRCLLFLEDSESQLNTFLCPGGSTLDEQELSCIRISCDHGGDVNDGLLWILLKATSSPKGIDSEMAILLLEHLFEKCSRNKKGSLVVNDPHLVWELYNFVQYSYVGGSFKMLDSVEEREEIPRSVRYLALFLNYFFIITCLKRLIFL